MNPQTLTPPTEPTAELGEKPQGGRPPKYQTPPKYDELTVIDQQIVDYFAMDGLMPNYEGSGEKGRMIQLPAQKMAERLGYADRKSLYNRRDAIPGFDEIVLGRMPALYRRYMVTAVWKGVGLRGMRGDAKQAEMLLSHYAGYTPPAQKHEVKIDGLAEAVNAARTAARRSAALPGDVVDAPPLPTGSPQAGDNQPVLKPALVVIAAPDVNQKPDPVVIPPVVPAPGSFTNLSPAPAQAPNVIVDKPSIEPPRPALPVLRDTEELDEFGDSIIREFD